MEGDSGDDIVFGGQNNDNVYGDDGDDFVSGDLGDDYVSGGDGADTLIGGFGADEIYGGNGNDLFILIPNDQTDFIGDFRNGTDLIGLPNGLSVANLSIRQSSSDSRDTLLQIAGTDQILAILNSVDFTDIDPSDFIPV